MTLPAATAACLAAAPAESREGLAALRGLVLAVAGEAGIALREETRWGQPAFLASKGTTIRIGVPRGAAFALFVPCQTRLIEAFRAGPGAGMRFEGTRAVLFDRVDDIDKAALAILILGALRYREGGRAK